VGRRPHLIRSGLAAFASVALTAAVLFGDQTGASAAEAPVDLGTAAAFSVLAGTTVTNTGPTTVAQDLGVSPGSAVTGFPPGTVAGTIHAADATAATAQVALTAAYNDAAGRTPAVPLASELGSTTVFPGVYSVAGAQITGTLTLDGQGDPGAVFIFQMPSTIVTASASNVVFINGASACRTFWQVGSSATLGTGSSFGGNILALTSITMTTGVALVGRALARNGAVTMDTNAVTEAICPPIPPILPVTGPSGLSTLAGVGGGLVLLGTLILFIDRRRTQLA